LLLKNLINIKIIIFNLFSNDGNEFENLII